jgi:hypothetical protein
MNISGLSFNALPPIDLPFRFFLSAPLFIIACALLVIISGESLWLSRWQPNMLALTHGFTLGFLSMVMMGALLQLLPVIGGIGIAKPRIIAATSHALYCAGVIALMFSFILAHNWLILTALVLLSLGFGLYLAAIIWVLIKKISQGDSINGFRYAIISLVIVLLLGVCILANRVGITVPFMTIDKHITDVHALTGLVGWAGILIISVSFQVLPMFHVAPNMPKYIRQYLSVSLFILLMFYSVYAEFALTLIFISHGVFAVTLVYVIGQRKRKVPDTSIKYWQLAAATLLLLNVLYFLPDSFYVPAQTPLWMALPDKGMLLTAIFIYFYLLSVIQGMLLKILPFLSYTHLQQRCLIDFSAMQFIPHMHDFLSKKKGLALYYIHILSGLSLIAVIFEPSLYIVFAMLLLIEFVWLFILMVKCMRLYFSVNRQINLSSKS